MTARTSLRMAIEAEDARMAIEGETAGPSLPLLDRGGIVLRCGCDAVTAPVVGVVGWLACALPVPVSCLRIEAEQHLDETGDIPEGLLRRLER